MFLVHKLKVRLLLASSRKGLHYQRNTVQF